MKKFEFTPLEKKLIASTFETIEFLYDLDDAIQVALFGQQTCDGKMTEICDEMFGMIRAHFEVMGVNFGHIPEEITIARDKHMFKDAVDLFEDFIRKELESCQTKQ